MPFAVIREDLNNESSCGVLDFLCRRERSDKADHGRMFVRGETNGVTQNPDIQTEILSRALHPFSFKILFVR